MNTNDITGRIRSNAAVPMRETLNTGIKRDHSESFPEGGSSSQAQPNRGRIGGDVFRSDRNSSLPRLGSMRPTALEIPPLPPSSASRSSSSSNRGEWGGTSSKQTS